MPEATPGLDEWIAELALTLDLPPGSIDIPLLLDLARDAAHGIARPAAPLTTFVVGLAAGRAGSTRQDVLAAVAAAHALLAAR